MLVVVVAVVYPRAILQGREPDQEEDVKLIGKKEPGENGCNDVTLDN